MQLTVSKLPWYGQIGIFAALSLAAVAAFWSYYASPARAELALRDQQLQQLRAEINRGLAVARQLPQFQKQVAEFEARLEGLKAVLPDEKDVADLLRRIQTLAAQSNLTIKSFKPEPVVTRDLHIEWPFKLEIDGGYHNLGLFLDRIGKFPRIITISDVVIRAADNPTGNTTIRAECTATTFVLKETAGASAPAATPAQTVASR